MRTLESLDRFSRENATKIAIYENTNPTTFMELKRLSDALASYYVKSGLKSGDIVACLKTNMTTAIAATLAGLRAGVGFIILDHREDRSKLKALLATADVKLLVLEDPTLAVASYEVPTVALNDALSTELTEFPTPDPNSISYIEPTSGSTGAPKLVPITQDVLQHNIDRQVEYSNIQPQDRVALLGEMWMDTVLSGLNVGAQTEAFDLRSKGASELANWVNERKITTIQTFPAAIRAMFDAATEPFQHLNKVRLAGEVLTKTDVDKFEQYCPSDAILTNYYGSTECSFITQYTHESGQKNKHDILPIGQEVEGIQADIVNENFVPLADGALGQLVIRSKRMALGYLNNPDKTKGVYWQEPNGTCVLATGDLAFRDRDGLLHVVGRVDDQVKIRGYSVRYSEVEEAIMRNRDISEVAVTSILTNQGIRQLIAHVVFKSGTGQDIPLLKKNLRSEQPAYMVPSYIASQSALPKTDSGKIDKKKLPSLANFSDQKAQTEWPDTQHLEIAKVWGRILGHNNFTQDDDFFDIGGDSLQAMSMVVTLERLFKQRVGYESLVLDGASIARIAARLNLNEADAPGGLRELKKGHEGRPLYILPVENGEFSNWLFTLNAMTSNRPVFGAHVRHKNERTSVTKNTAAELGEYAANSIVAAQNETPCFIAGYSASAYLAIETARAVLAKGGAISGLILIEPPTDVFKVTTRLGILKRAFAPLIKSNNLALTLNRIGHLLFSRTAAELEFADDAVYANYKALELEGVTTLLACSIDGNPQIAKQKSLWRKVLPEDIEFWDVPGFHNTVLKEDNGTALAPKIEAWMHSKEHAKTD